jgi:hypothetical protein
MESSDANRYRMLADEARRCAADMRDDDCKQMMVRIALEYEDLANRADWLTSRDSGRPQQAPYPTSDGAPVR